MIGYCCINETLKKQGITVNRGMQKAKFEKEGLKLCGELAYQNLKDMLKILEWNVKHNILLYRMSSDMFPWMSAYELNELPNFDEIRRVLLQIANYAKYNNIRLTFHPGPFNILASDNEETVKKTIKELNQHSEIMDMLYLYKYPYNCINIHIGTTKGGKFESMDRFISNYHLLNNNTQSRLTVENDDSTNGYSVEDLLYLHIKIGIPIVFDQHHYEVGAKGTQSMKDALKFALETWKGERPLTHISSSKKEYEDNSVRSSAHADYIYNPIFNPNNLIFDTDIEAKMKELAVLKYKKDFEI